MIGRRSQTQLHYLLAEYPAVALLGPRQVGKTTIALEIADADDAVYLDLESSADRARLTDPELYLADYEDRLVIFDEVHRLPGLFQSLRGLIDRGRRRGEASKAVSAAGIGLDGPAATVGRDPGRPHRVP